jgi:polyhydroxyalkanoate synthase
VSAGAPGGKAHVLGYCMGGTLAAIHAAVHPERLASFIALAAPVTFHDGSLLSTWVNAKGFDIDALVDATGNVPWQLLQGSFQMLRPTLNLQKAVSLIDRAWNDEFLDGFLAIETWGADNVSLPGEFYRRFITGLYQQDLLIKGEFTLGEHPVHLERLVCPTLAVSFDNDNIVPGPSASALIDACGASVKEHLHLPGGHVGAVVSRHAAKTLWPRLADFFARFEQRPDVAPVALGAAAGQQPPPIEPLIAEVEVPLPSLASSELPAPGPGGRRVKGKQKAKARPRGQRRTPTRGASS